MKQLEPIKFSRHKPDRAVYGSGEDDVVVVLRPITGENFGLVSGYHLLPAVSSDVPYTQRSVGLTVKTKINCIISLIINLTLNRI